jgi:hypothetical protein
LAIPETAHVEFTVPADVLSADGDFVVKDVPVLFRADKYEFPEEDGGPFEMTADDIRRALEKVPPDGVPITNEHNKRCWFKGKLGRFFPAVSGGDYSKFGGKAKFPLPVVQLSGPGPYGLSANFRRADKTLQDVSLTWTPRIDGAAAFTAFAAFAKSEGASMEHTPHGRSAMQAVHDMAAQSGALCKGKKPDKGKDDAPFTSQHERDAMQAIHDTATATGADCNVYSDAPAEKLKAKREDMMASYSEAFGPPRSQRELQLEARLKAVEDERAAERQQREREKEVAFSARLASFGAEAEAFADSLRDRLTPEVRPLCIADYVRCAEDDLRGAGDVQFSRTDGKQWKGTRLEACKLRWRAVKPHRLLGEAGQGELQAVFSGGTTDPEAAETERLQKAMEERAARENGRHKQKAG